jgi:hypothetical protein
MRKTLASLVAVLCTAGIFAPISASASPQTSQPVGSSTIGSGSMCLEATGTSVGSAVDVATCDPTNPDQQWAVTVRGSFRLWGYDKFVSNGSLGIDISYQAGEVDWNYNNNHTLSDQATGNYLTWNTGNSNPQPGEAPQDGQSDQTWYIFTYLGDGHKKPVATTTGTHINCGWNGEFRDNYTTFPVWGESKFTSNNCSGSKERSYIAWTLRGNCCGTNTGGWVSPLNKWSRATASNPRGSLYKAWMEVKFSDGTAQCYRYFPSVINWFVCNPAHP